MLRDYRISARLSQPELAARVGWISAKEISKIENGRRGVDVLELSSLAKGYGVTASALMDAWDSTPKNARAEDLAAVPYIDRRVRYGGGARPAEKRRRTARKRKR